MEYDQKILREFGKMICRIAAGDKLSRNEAREAYRQVIMNEQPELQQGAFLMAHIARGPSIEELAGAWEALDRFDTAKIHADSGGVVCDIVGTGSDPLKTVNCSTPAAFITAACGVPVAKKGARLVTGVSGASDILEKLGIDLDAPLNAAEDSLRQHGICYLPGEAFLKSGWARLIKHMRFTSAFNIIGPLTRPCPQTNCIVIGAYSPRICDQLIAVLKEIGMKRALAPFGTVDQKGMSLGMDEFSPCGITRVVELKDGKIDVYNVVPEDFGLKQMEFSAIASGNSSEANCEKVKNVLTGDYDSPLADFFCMNAGAALYAAGTADDYAAGFSMAKEALTSGKAWEKFELMRQIQGKSS